MNIEVSFPKKNIRLDRESISKAVKNDEFNKPGIGIIDTLTAEVNVWGFCDMTHATLLFKYEEDFLPDVSFSGFEKRAFEYAKKVIASLNIPSE
ncbi:hypothetical protein [Photorhabdus cinerea]|uniref:Uncharacterized protein n=1 Tax=Photorhabdus cinerea TaxID=471575 RepID=A0A7X5QHK2_9GAMM|nr:hypothetical protein [Photorhabdus cinerea]NHB94447.1 hypothetical protein [Photorhabdus cinerea]